MNTEIKKAPEDYIKEKEENTKQPTHNECADCGEIIRHDQWSEKNFTLCIDCG